MDLDLHIGSALHLELPGGEKAVVRLIGLVPGRSLIVTAPESGARLLPLAVGDRVSARVYAGADALAFQSAVAYVTAQPFAYVHLRYPAAIESTPLRHAQRARVHLAGTVQSDRVPGRELPVSLHDLSTLGAMLWSEVPLGEVGEALLLRVPLEADAMGVAPAELVAEIRNLHESHDAAHRRWGYGVEFASMSSATALALRALVMRELDRSAPRL